MSYWRCCGGTARRSAHDLRGKSGVDAPGDATIRREMRQPRERVIHDHADHGAGRRRSVGCGDCADSRNGPAAHGDGAIVGTNALRTVGNAAKTLESRSAGLYNSPDKPLRPFEADTLWGCQVSQDRPSWWITEEQLSRLERLSVEEQLAEGMKPSRQRNLSPPQRASLARHLRALRQDRFHGVPPGVIARYRVSMDQSEQ